MKLEFEGGSLSVTIKKFLHPDKKYGILPLQAAVLDLGVSKSYLTELLQDGTDEETKLDYVEPNLPVKLGRPFRFVVINDKYEDFKQFIIDKRKKQAKSTK